MAQRPTRSRTTRAFPKTLTGILASIALAVLAALGVKTDWFHGKPSTPPTRSPTGARTAPAPGDLPRTRSAFTRRAISGHEIPFNARLARMAEYGDPFNHPLIYSQASDNALMEPRFLAWHVFCYV